jgi:NAD(P)-dependent dehydrogenase (short-subunit alcohol dehydrogenase family)
VSPPVALVAGGLAGARGLVVDELARRGWSLALNYPSGRAAAERRVAELREAGTTALGLFAGLDQEGTGRVLVSRTVAELGGLDAVVIDPAPPSALPFEQVPERWLEDVVAAGLLGPHRVARAALAPLRERRGRLVVVARGGGVLGGMVGGGLAGWAQALGAELAPSGVAVACVGFGLPDARPAGGAAGEQGVARAVVEMLTGDAPAPGVRVDVAAPLSSAP